MLKELRLVNWKSFRDATLYIDPLTVIIGMNASGKSNALDALLFLQKVTSGMDISTAITGDAGYSGLRGGLEWVVRKPEKTFTLEALVASGEEKRTDYRYSITVTVNETRAELTAESLVRLKSRSRSDAPDERNLFVAKSEEATAPAVTAHFYTGTQGRGKRLDFDRAYSILSRVDKHAVHNEVSKAVEDVIEQLSRIFILDPIPGRMRDYKPLSEKLRTDAANIAGVLAALPDERKKEVETTLTDYLKKLPERDIGRVWTELIGKFKRDAMLYCEETWTENGRPTIVDLRGMSDGTLRFLAIVTALLTLQKGSLLVVEEADNGLHPSRAKVLVNMLRQLGAERNIDVIVTTHNPAMLDDLGIRMVPFVSVAHRDAKTGESLISQLEDMERLPKLLASGGIGQMSARGKIEAALKAEEIEGAT